MKFEFRAYSGKGFLIENSPKEIERERLEKLFKLFVNLILGIRW